MIEAKLVKIEAVDEEFEHMLRVSGVTRSGEGHGSSQSGHDLPRSHGPYRGSDAGLRNGESA